MKRRVMRRLEGVQAMTGGIDTDGKTTLWHRNIGTKAAGVRYMYLKKIKDNTIRAF